MNDINQLIAAARDGEVRLVALVRNSEGNVKYDDPHNVPQVILDQLTEDDLRHLETLKRGN